MAYRQLASEADAIDSRWDKYGSGVFPGAERREPTSMSTRVSRRQAVKVGAAAAALPLVHIRTAGAAGKLKLALWDHWVPSGNAALKTLVDAWAEKNKVEVQLDFLTAIGEKKAACATLDKLKAEFPAPRADLKDGIAGARQKAAKASKTGE